MASEPPAEATATEEETVPTDWRPVPTIVVDAAIGNVLVGGVHRVTFAEFALNPELGASRPLVRPVITLAMTPASVAHIIEYLTKLILPAGGEQHTDAE